MLEELRREREGKERGGEEGGAKPRGGQALGGGGRKAKSITSLLERSQKGKDMSQWTDCTSLPLWMEAKPLVFKSPVLELELGSVEIRTVQSVCLCMYICMCVTEQVQRGSS